MSSLAWLFVVDMSEWDVSGKDDAILAGCRSGIMFQCFSALKDRRWGLMEARIEPEWSRESSFEWALAYVALFGIRSFWAIGYCQHSIDSNMKRGEVHAQAKQDSYCDPTMPSDCTIVQ